MLNIWRCIYKLIKPRKDLSKLKIAFIVGHNEKRKGAYSKYLSSTEWDYYRSFESDISKAGDVFYHDPTISGYNSRCREISERIGGKYDIIVPLHFNKFNSKVGGCEVWYWHKNEEGKRLASLICSKTSSSMNISNRGPKPIKSKSQRGGGEVFYPKGTSLLVEPFFGDNKSDTDNFDMLKFIDIIKNIE